MKRFAILRVGFVLLTLSCANPLFASAYRSPQDVAFAPDGGVLAVGDSTAEAVHLMDSASHGILFMVPLAGQASGLAWSADGRRLFAAESGAGDIAEHDRASGEVTRRFTIGRFPQGLAIAANRNLLLACDYGNDQLAAIDLERLHAMIGPDPDAYANDLAALHRGNIMRRIDLPAKGPRGITITPDGRALTVAGYFSGNVVMLDAGAENPVSISLGPQPEPDIVRRGEMAFHDANRCFQRWLSCATCHPGARSDGLNWDLLNDGIGNPKNTRTMLLSHATPPVMSLGVRDKMETAVRAGFIHIQFTQPEPGEVEAVNAYLKSLEPATSPHRQPDGSLTTSAARGEAIFHRESTACAQCHPARCSPTSR